MKIKITVREAFNKHIWDKVCQMRGLNEWAVAEGLMSSDEELEFTEEEANQLGLTTKSRDWSY